MEDGTTGRRDEGNTGATASSNNANVLVVEIPVVDDRERVVTLPVADADVDDNTNACSSSSSSSITTSERSSARYTSFMLTSGCHLSTLSLAWFMMSYTVPCAD